MPSHFTSFIQTLLKKYNDPGLDYLVTFLAVPYDPNLLTTQNGKSAYQTKVFQTTRVVLYWKYQFGSLRTRRMIEGIQRLLNQIHFYNNFPKNLQQLIMEITPYLITRPINYTAIQRLPQLKEVTLPNTHKLWNYYQLPQIPLPTDHFYHELITPYELPRHDWRITLPQIPHNDSLLSQYILTNHFFLTFTLKKSNPSIIESIYLVSTTPIKTNQSPLHIE